MKTNIFLLTSMYLREFFVSLYYRNSNLLIHMLNTRAEKRPLKEI